MKKERGKIFILSGPSGSGKTTLYKKILSGHDSLARVVTVTTRSRRENEKHGRDYFFVSRKMFLAKKRARHFLESQKVFDNYYGTPKAQVVKFLHEGKNVFLCIDVKGAKVVRRHFPKAISIFIKTSSLDELKRRLENRGSESCQNMGLRLKIAKEELKEAAQYNYVVVNDQLAKALKQLNQIIHQEIGV